MDAGPEATTEMSVTSEVEPGPLGREDVVEPRVVAAWRAWLVALATDPEAAIAAAMAYEAMDAQGRTRWLDALDQDAPALDVPPVAVYAPLLSVEDDPVRRERIRAALEASELGSARQQSERAFRGASPCGDRLAMIVMPLYLDFVQLIACRFRPGDGFVWVRRDPIVHVDRAPRDVTHIDDVMLERTPLDPVVEEIAHAVVAHQRTGKPLPEALEALVRLLGPTCEPCG